MTIPAKHRSLSSGALLLLSVVGLREEENQPGSARNTGDIALETVAALITVLEHTLEQPKGSK